MIKTKKDDHLEKIKDEISNNDEIKESVKAEVVDNDEPSWYHYLIVIMIFIGILFGLSQLITYLDSDAINSSSSVIVKNESKFYYDFEVRGKNVSVEFSNSKEYLNNLSIPIEISKIDLMNSKEIYFSFSNYSEEDNYDMTVNQYKLGLFMRSLLQLRVDGSHRVSTNIVNCSNSTEAIKVIEFLPYQNISGVFFDGIGCIQIKSKSVSSFIDVEDKMLLSFLNE